MKEACGFPRQRVDASCSSLVSFRCAHSNRELRLITISQGQHGSANFVHCKSWRQRGTLSLGVESIMRLKGGFIASTGGQADPYQPFLGTLTSDALPCTLERHLLSGAFTSEPFSGNCKITSFHLVWGTGGVKLSVNTNQLDNSRPF